MDFAHGCPQGGAADPQGYLPAVRQLLPEPLDDVDPVHLHAGLERPAPEGRPWVLGNMISSADGATAVEGRSGGLGGPGDALVFRAVRAVADVILVAAGTATVEGYGPPQVAPEIRERRSARGQEPTPRIVVVTNRLSVDLGLRLFTDADPGPRPIIATAAASPSDRRAEAAERAEVLVVGEDAVDLPALLAQLAERGAGTVLCEGGPRLNGSLIAEGLLDELNLTLSPVLAGGDSPRIVHGAPPALRPLHLERVLEADGLLFLRYVRG